MNTKANKNTHAYDVVIVGAGLVGSSLALALNDADVRVAVVEAKAAPSSTNKPASQDERSLVLANATVEALVGWGVLPREAAATALLRSVHASSERDFGAVRFDAEALGVPFLGRTVPASELAGALDAALTQTQADVFRPATVSAMTPTEGGWSLALQQDDVDHEPISMACQLLVAADGTHSPTRARLGIGTTHHDYQQTLFVANAKFSQSPPSQAWMRFTPNGPTALLPRADGWMGTVSTVSQNQAEALADMSDADYVAFLHERVGYRLGRIQAVGKRTHYPLHLQQANQLTAHRAVLVGNAAQSLNPIGAQGFNLGIRDAVTLAAEIKHAVQLGQCIGSAAMLQAYEARRATDRTHTIRATDGLSKVFGRQSHAMSLLRSVGFSALSWLPPVREHIAMQAMGWQAWPRDHFSQGADQHGH